MGEKKIRCIECLRREKRRAEIKKNMAELALVWVGILVGAATVSIIALSYLVGFLVKYIINYGG